ncbi:RING FINGER PROTEIN 25 [Salix koriyanagi]|uniref:RING FINGER PROTEIN 25 n=1 Tax=Salix koriyanagi TaxID=2511006 RepID=A0A9Q0TE24_9ROSI|nr:RING FINGER PROTEIN 25 [Salix koriyanagi]
MAEEEVLIEVEAVLAVYGDDCVILDSFPPHLHLHIKPRTADISSQQFVEAVIGIRAGPQYPSKPPWIDLIESKGLDGERQKQLITGIQEKARELSSCLMLVALCEEAVEKLSVMNHPDGDCSLCLYPLVPEDEQDEALPFMKLMSCFHCFHCECIVRLWNWIQKEKESSTSISSSTTLHQNREMGNQNGLSDVHGLLEERMGNCPVCRKVFHAKDFEHVLDLVGTQASQMNSEAEIKYEEKLLHSDSENFRRQKFEAILKLQQENSGLIEPKRDIVVVPGIYLPQRATAPAQTVNRETAEHQGTGAGPSTETNLNSSLNRPRPREHRNPGRRQRLQKSRRPVSQWVRRENGTPD